jgi:hypothetical protein
VVRIDNVAYGVDPPRAPRVDPGFVPRSWNVEAHLPGLALFAMIALLFVSLLQAMVLARYRRTLESQLDEAHSTIRALRARLDDATRPPTQFARMRLRRVAVDRAARLRLAAPRGSQLADVSDGRRVRAH